MNKTRLTWKNIEMHLFSYLVSFGLRHDMPDEYMGYLAHELVRFMKANTKLKITPTEDSDSKLK